MSSILLINWVINNTWPESLLKRLWEQCTTDYPSNWHIYYAKPNLHHVTIFTYLALLYLLSIFLLLQNFNYLYSRFVFFGFFCFVLFCFIFCLFFFGTNFNVSRSRISRRGSRISHKGSQPILHDAATFWKKYVSKRKLGPFVGEEC